MSKSKSKKQPTSYRVFFIDAKTGKPAMQTDAVPLKCALEWVKDWEDRPVGHVAVIWPSWAKHAPRIKTVDPRRVPVA